MVQSDLRAFAIVPALMLGYILTAIVAIWLAFVAPGLLFVLVTGGLIWLVSGLVSSAFFPS